MPTLDLEDIPALVRCNRFHRKSGRRLGNHALNQSVNSGNDGTILRADRRTEDASGQKERGNPPRKDGPRVPRKGPPRLPPL